MRTWVTVVYELIGLTAIAVAVGVAGARVNIAVGIALFGVTTLGVSWLLHRLSPAKAKAGETP